VRQRWTNCGEASADCLSLKGFSMSRATLAPGLVVDIYNLHMDAGSADTAFRAENVEQLSAYIETNSAGNAVIVGGDFNLNIGREPDATQFATLLSRASLSDACSSLGCPEPNRIDKFLYRSSATVTISPTSWTNADPDFTRADGEPLSDHDPVVVGFDWSRSVPG
jgi:endonuclease/exonuclease/phosphatase (EEP) superfamily protein YafD